MGDAEDARELLRTEVVRLVRHLHSTRVDKSQMAASRLKDLVLASNPAQRANQDLIAGVEGALDGLVTTARYARHMSEQTLQRLRPHRLYGFPLILSLSLYLCLFLSLSPYIYIHMYIRVEIYICTYICKYK